jgi:hypothetical protein
MIFVFTISNKTQLFIHVKERGENCESNEKRMKIYFFSHKVVLSKKEGKCFFLVNWYVYIGV